jgi:anti-sigma-K factor RskA
MNGHPIPEENFDLYALGVLEGEEKQLLVSHVASCAVCGRELEEARGRVAMLAISLPPQAPPARVKEQLLRKIADTPRQTAPERYRIETVRPSERRWNWWSPVWATVAAGFAVIAMLLWSGNHRLNNEVQQLRAQFAEQSAQEAQNRSVLNLIAAADTKTISLAPTPETPKDMPTVSGRVFYNARLGQVFYSGALPAPSATQTYQLWLVPATGNPISAGIFQPGQAGADSSLTATVPAGTTAKAFAVTIEPAGGKPQPTGPKVLIGAA